MNTQKINELREKYQTAKLATYKEMKALHCQIGDNKFYAILTANQIIFYRKEYDKEKAENAPDGDY